MAAMALDKQKQKKQQQQQRVTASSDVPFPSASAEMRGHMVPASQQREASQPDSTAASSTAASPRVTGASDVPFTAAEMRGYKVRLSDDRAAYPTERRCAMCGKGPPAVPSLSTCGECRLVSYCSLECQRNHWRAAHKNVCKDAKTLSNVGAFRYDNEAPVKYVYGMMSEDEFYELQRRKEDQIISELASRPLTKVSMGLVLTRFRHVNIGLLSYVKRGERDSQATSAVKGARVYSLKEDACRSGALHDSIDYPTFRFARLSLDTTPFSELHPDSLRSMLARLVRAASRAIEDLILSYFEKTRHLPILDPLIEVRSPLDMLFWADKTATVTIGGKTFVFYFLPDMPTICTDAVVHSCMRLFGEDVTEQVGLTGNVHLSKSEQFLKRNHLKGNIVHFMQQHHFQEYVNKLCQRAATKSHLSFSTVKERLLEKALEYTDIFRKHLLDFSADMAANTMGGWTLAGALGVTDAQVQAAREEVQVLNPRYWPYLKSMRESLAHPPPEHHAQSDGRMLTLADGERVSEIEMMLSTQGLI
ncbi:unnamed protein product [Vitrella brassicaformis CCMP3155]|uniref:MYND-type domain-containing protein n=1 Tax=Vitrella brassicaformis (strain CCMP3155) TaxID=1169540 RepID=A0A0G4H005_VITBC|nr:unnamed protein product [Vitrella brassicaformis CCMP3155]|eukprot:CEM36874.1 unnamed protein product [Vitrella brassicaformis CCMP3155]